MKTLSTVLSIAVIATAAGAAFAADIQQGGRSSVYATNRTATALPSDAPALHSRGRGSVYAWDVPAPTAGATLTRGERTVAGNGRGSVYASQLNAPARVAAAAGRTTR